MRLLLLKWLTTIVFGLLRIFHWNRELPQVGAVHRNLRYGSHRLQRLDLFRPPEEDGPYPVLVFLHGGGFALSDKKNYERVCREFAGAGFVAVSVNYRLAPGVRFPDPAQDTADALDWLAANVSAYGGDPQRMILGGDSAGAHLAAWYAVATTDSELCRLAGVVLGDQLERRAAKIRGLLLFYGSYDVDGVRKTDFPLKGLLLDGFLGVGEGRREREQLASPLRYVVGGFPRAFVCAGEADPLFSESISLLRALEEQGVYHEKLLFGADVKEAEHGFINFYRRECARTAMGRAISFAAEAVRRRQ